MTEHILAGLSGVYQAIKENGVIDIGLAAAHYKGVSEVDYIQIPQCCFKQTVFDSDTRLTSIANLPRGWAQSHL